MTKYNQGDMRVWWIPQVGISTEPFYVPVKSIEHGAQILNVLAEYDAYQFIENIKGDYANAGGISVYDDGEWYDYENEDEKTNWESDPLVLFPQPSLGWCNKLNDL